MYVCVGQVYIFPSTTPPKTGNGDKILAVVNYDEKILCKYLRNVAEVRTHANTLATFIHIQCTYFVDMCVDLKIIAEMQDACFQALFLIITRNNVSNYIFTIKSLSEVSIIDYNY